MLPCVPEELDWPLEPVGDAAPPPLSVVVPAMSREERVSGVATWQERERTLCKVGLRVVGLDVGLGNVCGDTHGNEVLEGGLELVVKLDRLGHGKVVELVGKHDGTTLSGVSDT